MTARVRSGKQQANSSAMLAPSLKPRRDGLSDAKVVKQGGSVTGHVVDRERLPGCHGTSVPAAVHQDQLISFLQIPLVGVEYMMGLAVSVEHQDRCSVADNLIVEMCLGSIKICAFHDVFFHSGKTERPRGSVRVLDLYHCVNISGVGCFGR